MQSFVEPRRSLECYETHERVVGDQKPQQDESEFDWKICLAGTRKVRGHSNEQDRRDAKNSVEQCSLGDENGG